MTNQEPYSIITLSDEDKKFIADHLHQPTDQLAFSMPRTPKSKFLIHQIQSRKKIKTKLPSWYENPDVVFPNSLSLEQCSSEATARFKKNLISGNTLIDITGGLGIDTSYLSANFTQTIYFDQQQELVEYAKHNFSTLGLNSITSIHDNATDYLEKNPLTADWIYADPARRDDVQRKVYHLSDCTPDIQQQLPLLLSIAPNILIKTSPVLDIDLTIKTLPGVSAVYVLGFEQECKEVLYHISRESTLNPNDIPIHIILLERNGDIEHSFRFSRKDEHETHPTFSEPKTYLYEPHPAVLKAGALKAITQRYQVEKISVNSHLYTSDNLAINFPGRIFKIQAEVKPDAKLLHPYLGKSQKANLTIRNFPASVSDLRNKLRLKEGGDKYLFATTLTDKRRIIIVTEKFNIS